MSASAAPRGTRVEALDLLRLFAALSVMFYHYGFRGAAGNAMTWLSLPALIPIAKYGYLGVQLFFVISGFLIARSAEGRTVRQFAVARASRIYPGFLSCMTITFVVTLLIGAPRFDASLVQWAANLVIFAPVLKQPFMDGVYWSIVYEIIFYGWMAALIATGLFPRHLPMIVAVWLAASEGNEIMIGSAALRRLLLTDQSGFFSAGLLLYTVYSSRRGAVVWILLAVSMLASAEQAIRSGDWVRTHLAVPLHNPTIVLISLAIVLVVGASLLPKRVPMPAGVLLALGGLTYPLYLIHENIGFMTFNRLAGLAPPPVLFAGTVVLMLAVSWLIWRFVEKPGQRWLKSALTGLLRQHSDPSWSAQTRSGSKSATSLQPRLSRHEAVE